MIASHSGPLSRYVIHYLSTKKRKVFLTLILVALAKVGSLSAPFALKFIVDISSGTESGEKLVVTIIGLVTAYVLAIFLGTLFDELKSVVAEATVQPLIASVGGRIFSNLINQSHDTLVKSSFGATIKDIERGLKSLQSVIALAIHTIFPLIVELVVITIFTIVYFDLYFAMILCVGIILHLYVTMTSTTSLAVSREKLNAHDSVLSGKLTEAINNLETIKIFDSEKFEARRYTFQFHSYARAAIQYQLTYSRVHLVQQAIVCGILLTMMIRAGWDLSRGDMTPGDFVLINAMAMQVLIPITFVGTVWKDLGRSIVDIKALSSYLQDSKFKKAQTNNSSELSEVCIRFDDVSFGHSESEPILSNISLEVENGDFVAIVGASGSGKSTILKLMAGLIDPLSGRILVNGERLGSDTQAAYTQAMAMVPQNVVLFHGSIAENIAYSNRHATENEIIEAAKRAQLHPLVENLPQGYKTPVGERGLRLSGGERQLLGLARAFLKKPKLLLLDEPSSALDAKTEASWIENSLLKATALTRVVVTHRLNSVQHADKIYVVEAGRVVDEGTHQELIRRNGIYAELWQSQLNLKSPE